MMRWIRWKYVAPRLAIVALLAVVLYAAVPRLVRWSLVTSGRAAFGAKVDVGDVEWSPWSGRFAVHDLAVADPERPLLNLFTADRAVFEVERGSLAKKRFVVSRGAIEGLEIGTPRTSQGETDSAPGHGVTAALDKLASSAADHGQAWLASYWPNLQAKLQEDLRREFQSVALADGLSHQWPALYRQYDTRVEDLVKRGHEVEAAVREARENPLRNLSELRQATQQIDQLNGDLGRLLDDLANLSPQLELQRQAVWDAWAADRRKLQEGFALDPASAAAVTDYLLEKEVAGRVGAIVNWIQRLRSLVPTNGDGPAPVRHRGANVLFAGLRRHPDYLVRTLELHGTGRHKGETFELTGSITGLCTQPALYGRPTVVKLVGRGSVELEIDAELDHSGATPADRFAVRFPNMRRPALRLGRPESFALNLGAGRDEMEADLKVEESALTGTVSVTMHTRGVQATNVDTEMSARLVESFNASLADVDRIEAKVHVGGPLSAPTLRMESALGSQVLAAVQSAASQAVAVHRQELEAALRQHVERKLEEGERLVEDYRRQIEKRLTEQQTTLIRLAADTFGFGDRPTIRLSTSERGESPSTTSDATFQR